MESVPLARAELAMGVPLVRVAKKFGISRQWLRQTLDKAGGAAPSSDPGPHDAVSVGTEGPQGTTDAEGKGNKEVA